jgi:ribose 5-phosphate isomerase A
MLRTVDGKVFVSDNGNWIVDCGVRPIEAPGHLARDLRAIPGVVETGLFLGLAHLVLVVETGRIRELKRGDSIA